MEKRYTLPNMEKKFSIQVVGKESGLNWVGDFAYRRPTISERGLIEIMKTRLNGDLLTIDSDIAYLNAAIAHLRFTLRTYPDWWKESDFGGAMYDTNVIVELYQKCIEFERTWSEKVLSGDASRVEEPGEGMQTGAVSQAEAAQ